MDFHANGAPDGGLRFRGSTTAQRPPSQQQQSNQQRPPPPKASMSMGYMPVLIDESLFPDDKKTDPVKGATLQVDTATKSTAIAPITTPTYATASTTTTASSNSTDASRWVMITGYVTKAHFDRIRHRFASLGNVLHTRGVFQDGRTNWYAVQYETSMEAEQVLSLGTFLLVDGIWISVNRVTPELLATLDSNYNYQSHQHHHHNGSLFPNPTTPETAAAPQHEWNLLLTQARPQLDPARLDFSGTSSTSTNGGDHGKDLIIPHKKKTWDESEIYLNHRYNRTPNKNPSSLSTGTSMCDKIMNWIFGWDHYES